jgi:hypothetical protein
LPTVYARTLRRAAEIVGGDAALATWLRVTPSHLALWLADAETPPMEVFLKAVDVVTDDTVRESDS